MDTPSPPFTLHCGAGVADVLRHTDQMIKTARSNVTGHPGADIRITEMELSLLRSLRMLMDLAAGTGDVHLARDSARSLTFVVPSLQLGGAMIFHPDAADGRTLLTGEWILHS